MCTTVDHCQPPEIVVFMNSFLDANSVHKTKKNLTASVYNNKTLLFVAVASGASSGFRYNTGFGKFGFFHSNHLFFKLTHRLAIKFLGSILSSSFIHTLMILILNGILVAYLLCECFMFFNQLESRLLNLGEQVDKWFLKDLYCLISTHKLLHTLRIFALQCNTLHVIISHAYSTIVCLFLPSFPIPFLLP